MKIHNFEFYRGDTIDELIFTLKNKNTLTNVETPTDLTGAYLRLEIRQGQGALVKAYDSAANGGIEIHDPTQGKFKILQHILDMPAGAFDYDIQYTLSGDIVKTFIRGKWTVPNDISKKNRP